ncbi:MAG: hypothetical protein ACUVRR_10540, partial [Candidatus Fervidibacter sp.]
MLPWLSKNATIVALHLRGFSLQNRQRDEVGKGRQQPCGRASDMSEQERLQNSEQKGEGETKTVLTRIRGLITIFVILTVLLVVLVVNSPESAFWRVKWQARWKARERERQFQEALARDQKMSAAG